MIVFSAPFDFPKEKVIQLGREIDAFQTSLKLSEGQLVYTFYDGPPFATGLPHYGHLLAGNYRENHRAERYYAYGDRQSNAECRSIVMGYYFVEKYTARAFRVLVDNYVTGAYGTGIVHQAPAFGDDDHRVLLAHGVVSAEEMSPCPIDNGGGFMSEITDFTGQHAEATDNEIEIQKVLKAKG